MLSFIVVVFIKFFFYGFSFSFWDEIFPSHRTQKYSILSSINSIAFHISVFHENGVRIQLHLPSYSKPVFSQYHPSKKKKKKSVISLCSYIMFCILMGLLLKCLCVSLVSLSIPAPLLCSCIYDHISLPLLCGIP